MAAGADVRQEAKTGTEAAFRPAVSACRSCPERVVFIEADNSDGWLSTDLTVDVRR